MTHRLFIAALALVCTLLVAACGDDKAGGAASPSPTPPVEVVAVTEPGNPDKGTGPMPDAAFRARLSAANAPTRLAPGQSATLTVKVRNASTVQWPMSGRPGDGYFQVNLGDHWLDAAGKEARIDDRIAMPRSLDRGEEAEMPYTVKAPDKPGDYVLEIDMVQEGVSWFAHKGSEPLKLNVRVGR